jgi:murein DD-endopeptidase MepM/ murein hydrolase activator NlpD
VWVSIDHPDGVRTSYGPLAALRVAAGDTVVRGAVLGLLADAHHGDGDVDRGLHWGARRDGAYVDPMRLPGLGPAAPDARR